MSFFLSLCSIIAARLLRADSSSFSICFSSLFFIAVCNFFSSLLSLLDTFANVVGVCYQNIRPDIRRPRRHSRRIDKSLAGHFQVGSSIGIHQCRRRNMRQMADIRKQFIMLCRIHHHHTAAQRRPEFSKSFNGNCHQCFLSPS